VPLSRTKRDIAHFGDVQTLPLPSRQQSFAGTASKLKGERAFVAIGVAQYCRADFAHVALIEAEHLASFDNRSLE